MLTLDLLKPTRLSKDLRRSHLATLTSIDEGRIRSLELRQSEPWFDEAVLLSRALCVDGILPLLSDSLTLSTLGSPLPTDLATWRSGVRPPLSLAVRIAIRFGLPDPCLLSVTPLQRQMWDVMQAGERHPEAPGWCVWCAADIIGGEPHRDTCLPANLYTPPRTLRTEEGLPAAVPRPRARVQRTKGIPAYGIKALREERELLQRDVAQMLGLHPNYYARIERSDVPLTVELADALSEAWGVDRAVLYARPQA
jgi:DNA-binding XRE family transcriptional regulator